jgi:hypothetical protein
MMLRDAGRGLWLPWREFKSTCAAWPVQMRSWRGCATVTVADAYVVDTGVFPRWFVDQDGFEHARELHQRLIDGSAAETVDFARVEVAGVLRKKGFLAGRLTLEEFTAAVRVIDDIGVTVHRPVVREGWYPGRSRR